MGDPVQLAAHERAIRAAASVTALTTDRVAVEGRARLRQVIDGT